MGDLLKSNPIFSKLGFDESNQWILYADGMQDFFNWMACNINESNIVTDAELRLEKELKETGRWYESDELEKRLAIVEAKHPGLLTYTEKDVNNLKNEVEALETMEHEYTQLNAKLEETKSNLNRELSDLEFAVHQEENRLQQATNLALEKAKELQEIQRVNAELTAERIKRFTEPYMPPLFIHEMPLDDYYSKCDLFQQYLNMYLEANVKIKTGADCVDIEESNNQTIDDLRDLERQFYAAELKLVKAKLRTAGLRKMIEELDISKVQAMTPSQLKNEIRELDANNHHLENETEALMSELKSLLQSKAQQQVENILLENTKIKFERASKRLETIKQLAQLVSESLSIAELLWIAMQLDLDKVKQFCDQSTAQPTDNLACARRIEAMLQRKAMFSNQSTDAYVKGFADLLASHLNIQRPTSLKACLHEYEKFCRMSKYEFKGIVEKKYYSKQMKQLEELKAIEETYHQYIFDGPTDKPMLENVKFMEPMCEARRAKDDIEKAIRRMRCNIQTNITDKMNNDRLWRFQQVLWMWFITEPKKVIQAIEEARRAASKGSNVKMLAGIKRRDNDS